MVLDRTEIAFPLMGRSRTRIVNEMQSYELPANYMQGKLEVSGLALPNTITK